MTRRYPQTIRDQAFALYVEGLSVADISGRLNVPKSTVRSWVTPPGQATAQRQKESPERKKYEKAYEGNSENRKRRRTRQQAPEYKWARKAYTQTLEYKERHNARKRTPEYRKRTNERKRERRATDPAYRALSNLRCRICDALNGSDKSASTKKLLGISVLELTRRWDVEYGLSWRNERDLHVDHVRPCASFDMNDPIQQCLCFNWRNLQLLPAAENRRKGDSWTKEMEQAWVKRMQGLGWDTELYLAF